MKALAPTLLALLIAGSALAQEGLPAAEPDASAEEGTDTEEPEEEAPLPPTSYNPTGAYVPAPPTVYTPSGAYTPSSPALDPQTRLPPTSYNPSGTYAPSWTEPEWTRPGAPAFIDRPSRTDPPSYADAAYESRLRSSFSYAQGMKGPLEGAWVVAVSGGADLYHLQLVDNAGGFVEGAWRDLRRPGATDASGLIVNAMRTGGLLNLRFYPEGQRDAVTATLTATADGGWSGELVEGGRRQAVVLRRQY